MSTILVAADTHCWNAKQLPEVIKKLVPEVDIVIHCGDYVRYEVLKWFSQNAKRFIGVRGNMDLPPIMDELPQKQLFNLDGKEIAVIHPDWGGPPFSPQELLPYFPKIDILLFGHTHRAVKVEINNVLCLNPGVGLRSYGLVTIEGSKIKSEIKFIR